MGSAAGIDIKNARIGLGFETAPNHGGPSFEHHSRQDRLFLKAGLFELLAGNGLLMRALSAMNDPAANGIPIRVDEMGGVLPIDECSDISPVAQIFNAACALLDPWRDSLRKPRLHSLGPWTPVCTFVPIPKPAHDEDFTQGIGAEGRPYEVEALVNPGIRPHVTPVIIRPHLRLSYTTPPYNELPAYRDAVASAGDRPT